MERNAMPQQKSIVAQFEKKSVVRFGGPVLFVLLLGFSFSAMFAQQPGQRTFASPEDAGRAFFDAMQKHDDRSPLSILGPSGKEILSSGDPAEDANARIGFVAKYQEMHRFVTEPDGTITLIVGAENWPFPIPLVNRNGSWSFDTPAGKNEILFRRIGKNELAAIDACGDLVEAQKQYFGLPLGDLSKQFAQKLVSDQDRHNGLYWQDAYNGFGSPISPLIAYADGKSANNQVGDRYPFNGYFFRILTSQGRHAPGGTTNYVINGRMTAGFAFIAYPAEYRSSGVMTFIVNRAGIIYEKDLGPDTTKLAEAMTAYDPDATWRHVQ
jgi:hypothetical protein